MNQAAAQVEQYQAPAADYASYAQPAVQASRVEPTIRLAGSFCFICTLPIMQRTSMQLRPHPPCISTEPANAGSFLALPALCRQPLLLRSGSPTSALLLGGRWRGSGSSALSHPTADEVLA